MAGEANAGSVAVYFRANVSAALSNFRAYNTALTQSVTRTQSAVRNIRQSLNTLNLAAGAGIGLAIARFGSNFDKSLTAVRSLTKESEEAFAETRRQVLATAKEIGVSASDAADAMYELVSAGIRGENAMRVLAASSKLAKAGLVDVATANNVLIGTLNAFQISSQESEDVAGKLIKTVDAGIFTFQDLASNLGKVSPLAKAAGVSLEELLAILASLTKSGLSFDLAVTQVAGAITALLKPTDTANKLIVDILGTTAEGSIAVDGFAATLEKLADSTEGSSTALAEIFPNVRALSGLLALATSGFGDLSDVISGIGEAGAESLREVLEIQVSSFSSLVSTIKNQVGNILTQVFEDNKKQILDVTSSILDFINRNQEAITTIVKLGSALAVISAGLIGFKVALFGVELALGGLRAILRLVDGSLAFYSRAIPLIVSQLRAFSQAQAVSAAATLTTVRNIGTLNTFFPAFVSGIAGARVAITGMLVAQSNLNRSTLIAMRFFGRMGVIFPTLISGWNGVVAAVRSFSVASALQISTIGTAAVAVRGITGAARGYSAAFVTMGNATRLVVDSMLAFTRSVAVASVAVIRFTKIGITTTLSLLVSVTRKTIVSIILLASRVNVATISMKAFAATTAIATTSLRGLAVASVVAVARVGALAKAIKAFILTSTLGIGAVVVAITAGLLALNQWLNPWVRINKEAKRTIKGLEEIRDLQDQVLAGAKRDTVQSAVAERAEQRLRDLQSVQNDLAQAVSNFNKGISGSAEAVVRLRDELSQMGAEIDETTIRSALEERIQALTEIVISERNKFAAEFGRSAANVAGAPELLQRAGLDPRSLSQAKNALRDLDEVMASLANEAASGSRDLDRFAAVLAFVAGKADESRESLRDFVKTLNDANLSDFRKSLNEIADDQSALGVTFERLSNDLQSALENVIPRDATVDIIKRLSPDPDTVTKLFLGGSPSEVSQRILDALRQSEGNIVGFFDSLGVFITESQAESIANILGDLNAIESGYAAIEERLTQIIRDESDLRTEIALEANQELTQLRIERLNNEKRELDAGLLAVELRYEREQRRIRETGRIAQRIRVVERQLIEATANGEQERIDVLRKELDLLTQSQTDQLEELERLRDSSIDRERERERERFANTEDERKRLRAIEEEKRRIEQKTELESRAAQLRKQIEQAKQNGLVRTEINLKSQLIDVEQELARVAGDRYRADVDLIESSRIVLENLRQQLETLRRINGTREGYNDLLEEAERRLIGTSDVFQTRENLRERFGEADTEEEATEFRDAAREVLRRRGQSLEEQRRELVRQLNETKDEAERERILREIEAVDNEIRSIIEKLRLVEEEYERVIEILRKEAAARDQLAKEEDIRRRGRAAGLTEEEIAEEIEKRFADGLKEFDEKDKQRIEERLRKKGTLGDDEEVIGTRKGRLVIGRKLPEVEPEEETVIPETTTPSETPFTSQFGQQDVDFVDQSITELNQSLTQQIQSSGDTLIGIVERFSSTISDFVGSATATFDAVGEKLAAVTEITNSNYRELENQRAFIESLRIEGRQ